MKILAIKFKYLGDIALMIPSLRALRQAHPNAEIHVLVPNYATPILETIPWIDKVWGFPKKGTFKEKWSLLSLLRKQKFDTSIDFVGNDRGAWISLFIGAKTRLGLDAPRGFIGRKYCYTHRLKEPTTIMHQVEKDLQLLSLIDIPKPDSIEPELYSDPAYASFANETLPAHAILCPISTSTDSKEWPISQWAALFNENLDLQIRLVFTSGTTERERKLLSDLKQLIPNASFIETPPTIPELIALVADAEAVICGDTFTSHIAAGLKTPLVVLFGPTRPSEWDPKGKSIVLEAPDCHCRNFFYKCTYKVHCLSQLPASKVRNALDTI